jgi:hypothetical protein
LDREMGTPASCPERNGYSSILKWVIQQMGTPAPCLRLRRKQLLRCCVCNMDIPSSDESVCVCVYVGIIRGKETPE